jgi:hypothetical protein
MTVTSVRAANNEEVVIALRDGQGCERRRTRVLEPGDVASLRPVLTALCCHRERRAGCCPIAAAA